MLDLGVRTGQGVQGILKDHLLVRPDAGIRGYGIAKALVIEKMQRVKDRIQRRFNSFRVDEGLARPGYRALPPLPVGKRKILRDMLNVDNACIEQSVTLFFLQITDLENGVVRQFGKMMPDKSAIQLCAAIAGDRGFRRGGGKIIECGLYQPEGVRLSLEHLAGHVVNGAELFGVDTAVADIRFVTIIKYTAEDLAPALRRRFLKGQAFVCSCFSWPRILLIDRDLTVLTSVRLHRLGEKSIA